MTKHSSRPIVTVILLISELHKIGQSCPTGFWRIPYNIQNFWSSDTLKFLFDQKNKHILIIDFSQEKFPRSSTSHSWNSLRGSISSFFTECRDTKRRCFVSNKKLGSEAVGTNQECYIIIKLGGKRRRCFQTYPKDFLRNAPTVAENGKRRFGDPSPIPFELTFPRSWKGKAQYLLHKHQFYCSFASVLPFLFPSVMSYCFKTPSRSILFKCLLNVSAWFFRAGVSVVSR